MAEFIRDDYNSRLQDAGLDQVILSLVNPKIESAALAAAVSLSIGEDVSPDAIDLYIADRWTAGELEQVEHVGNMPGGTPRYAAPVGLVADSSGVWFDSPASGTEYVRWYVNGAIRAREQRDLSVNRYMLLATIGAVSGSVVQVCIEAGGVVGWWARVALP